MQYTSFASESLLYLHRNNEALCEVVTANGRQYCAVTKDGYRTDWPTFDGQTVRWDNPEWFTKGFKVRAARIVKSLAV